MRKLYIFSLFLIIALSSTVSSSLGEQEIEVQEILSTQQKNQIFISLQDQISQIKLNGNIKLETEDFTEISDDIRDLISPLQIHSQFCQVCRSIFQASNYIPRFQIVALLDIIGTTVCTVQGTQQFKVCLGAVTQMVPQIINGAFGKWLDPDLACPWLQLCPQVYEIVNMDNYVHEILKDQPAQAVVPTPTYQDTFMMLHISDIHTDLEYEVGAKATCQQPVCCRKESGQPKAGDKLAGRWGTLGDCDLPPETAENMMKWVTTPGNLKKPVEMGLWTGDSTSHDVWHQSLKRNLENTVQITSQLQNYFPAVEPGFKYTPFVATMGNHQSFPVNVYDYEGNREQELQKKLGDVWEDWIGPQAAQSHRDRGFYSTWVGGNLGVRVIALNTQACNDGNWLLMKNPTDPFGQLEWLRNELYKSEEQDEAVYLISHIPSSSCLDEWARVYIALIDRFAYNIRGQFFGHSHSDSYHVYQTHDIFNKTIGVVYIGSSMTTYSDLNPEFRVFEIDRLTQIPKNYYQYRLDLNKWNSKPEINDPTWDLAYSYLEEYQLQNMHDYSQIDQLTEKLGSDLKTYQKYHINHNSGNAAVPQSISKEYYCSTNSLSTMKQICMNGKINVPSIGDRIFYKIMGPWRKKIDSNKVNK